MLQSIRDRTHGWIAGIIISLLILSFALWGIHSYLNSGGNTDVVATVNGDEISKQQVNAAFEPMRREAEMNAGVSILPTQVDRDLKQRALNLLVDIQVLKQASITNKYRVTTGQLDNYLKQLPQLQVDGKFSATRLQQLLASNMITPRVFMDSINTTLLIEQPRLGILLTSFATSPEVSQEYALINQERDISYVILPQDVFAKKITPVTFEEVTDYYNAHKNEFLTPEQVSIEYVQLSLADVMKNINPKEEEIKTFYDDNVNNFTQPPQWSLQEILIPIEKASLDKGLVEARKKMLAIQQQLTIGGDFAALAKQYPGEKFPQWVTLDKVPSELQKVVSQMKKAGDLSEPVQTEKGLVLLKAVAVKDQVVKPYAEARAEALLAYQRQKAEELFADVREKLASLTYETPDSLDKASKTLKLPVQTTEKFGRDAGTTELTKNARVREAAFNPDVLQSQNNSDVIQVTPDTAVVLRIKTHDPAVVLSLPAVEAKIKETLAIEKGVHQAQVTAEDMKQRLQKGGAIDQLARELGLTVNNAGVVTRTASNKVDSAILLAAFSANLPASSGGKTFVTTKVANGYAVVIINSVKAGAITKQEDFDTFAEQVQMNYGQLEYALYQRALKSNAKIETNLN